jgi:hypothetical protein
MPLADIDPTTLKPVDPADGAKPIWEREQTYNPITECDEPAVVVCFRRFRGQSREVIALFPELPSSYHPGPCDSFMMIGGHASANYHALVNHGTRIARRGEQDVEEMIEHLQRVYGYRLIFRERWDSRRNPQAPVPSLPASVGQS